MTKSKKLQIKTPRPYLSWSQLSLFERSPSLYERIYIDGFKQPENKYLKLGKEVAERLETGIETDNELIEHLALFMPKYPKVEFEIQADFKGIPVLGRLDCYDPKKRIVGEIKTGKNWSQGMVDKSGQLTFYAMLVWLKTKKLPSKIRLHWAKTKLDSDGDLQIVGDIKTFYTTRSISDIILMYGRVKKCWSEIIKMCN